MDFIVENAIVGVFIGLICLFFAGVKWLAKKFIKDDKDTPPLRTREEERNRFNKK